MPDPLEENAFAPVDSNRDRPAADGEDDIPVISEEMLHQERVDLEAGMSVFPRVTLVLMLACILVFVRQP